MKVKEIENLIVTYSEGATDNIADGVRYKDIANIIALEFDKLNKPAVIKSVCIAPKGECDRKPEDVCKECEGCKYLEKTVL